MSEGVRLAQGCEGFLLWGYTLKLVYLLREAIRGSRKDDVQF